MDYLMKKDLRIVCLGGGIGTVNLLRGLKSYTNNITVVVSMADDGGSAGRLRRLYSIPPPGDLINCIAAMSSAQPLMRELLTFRFKGNRYGSDHSLPGQKLGNLILVALAEKLGNFNQALIELQKLFSTNGVILPSTVENLSIWAQTDKGERVSGEKNIDLGKFKGRIIKLHLEPTSPTVLPQVKKALEQAEVIIAGPGDLYTTVLPVLIVPEILRSIKKSRAHKIFVVNVANKPFETPNYQVTDFINAIVSHCQQQLFEYFLVNKNYSTRIPAKYHYEYVRSNHGKNGYQVVKADLIDESFPLYHDSEKLAKKILQIIR